MKWRLRSAGTINLACVLNDHKYCGGMGLTECNREGCSAMVGHCIYCLAIVEYSNNNNLPMTRAYGNHFVEE